MSSPLLTLELNPAAFDADRFATDAETASSAGFSFLSLAHLGDTHTTRRRLYELAQRIVDDSPGSDPIESGFWEFVNAQLMTPSYDPRGVIFAVRDNSWLGLSVTTDHRAEGYMLQEHLWVAPAYRRRGLGVSMTAQAISLAARARADTVRAEVSRDDNALTSLYRTLGFKEPHPARAAA